MLRKQPERWSSKHRSYFIPATFVATHIAVQRPQQHFIDLLNTSKNMQNYNSRFYLQTPHTYYEFAFYFIFF